jgi:hypothetical protein
VRGAQGWESWFAHDTNPLYAVLHEAIYCQGEASRWAAQRVLLEDPRLAAEFDAVGAAEEGRPVGGAAGLWMACRRQTSRRARLRGFHAAAAAATAPPRLRGLQDRFRTDRPASAELRAPLWLRAVRAAERTGRRDAAVREVWLCHLETKAAAELGRVAAVERRSASGNVRWPSPGRAHALSSVTVDGVSGVGFRV